MACVFSCFEMDSFSPCFSSRFFGFESDGFGVFGEFGPCFCFGPFLKLCGPVDYNVFCQCFLSFASFLRAHSFLGGDGWILFLDAYLVS